MSHIHIEGTSYIWKASFVSLLTSRSGSNKRKVLKSLFIAASKVTRNHHAASLWDRQVPLDVVVQCELPNYPRHQPEERDFRDSGTDSSLGITALKRGEGYACMQGVFICTLWAVTCLMEAGFITEWMWEAWHAVVFFANAAWLDLVCTVFTKCCWLSRYCRTWWKGWLDWVRTRPWLVFCAYTTR